MTNKTLLSALAASAALSLVPAVASAENIVGIDTANRMVSFEAASSRSVTTKPITGLPAGEQLVGIDRRPATGQLIALGQSSRLYSLSLAGVATPVGAGPFAPALNGTNFGFDFNPTVDRIRVTSNFTQNLRLNPDSGAAAATDGALAYAAGDPNAGKVPAVSGSAYTNSVPMATTTQLFDIDVNQDALALQDPPNAGGLKTIGSLLVGDIQSPVGFDVVARTGNAFATMRRKGQKGTLLYTVNLSTGRALALNYVGPKRRPVSLRAMTVAE